MASVAKGLKGASHIKVHDHSLSISIANASTRIPQLLKLAEKSGVNVESVDLHKPTLEDVFIHFTGKTIRDREAGAYEKFKNHARVWRHRR